MNSNELVNRIRTGVLDVNCQELFYPLVIKGLLVNLRDSIKVRGESVPHLITHTGDDKMWIEAKGYDNSIEPLTISNEHNIYNIIPRCNVIPGGISLDTNQLTSPYSMGQCQIQTDDGVYTLKGEFRRMSIKMSVELKYQTDSYTDMLELIQYITTHLAFIRTYDIVYLGQKIKCSYKIADSYDDEHQMELDGAMSDGKEHKMNMTIEIESNMPVFSNRTIISGDDMGTISTNIKRN
jgi:hypothetical protein